MLGIGVEAIIAHRDLALVENMGSDSDDELQLVRPLQIFGVFLILIADLTLFLRERDPLQGQKKPDHIVSLLRGLGLSLGPTPASQWKDRLVTLCPP